MQDITDVAIRARDGDRDAVTALVRLTISDVRRYCGSLVDSDSADDLTQQTYLKMIEALPRYRGEAPAAAWLLRIARNTCVDEIRRRRRRRDTESVGLLIDPPERHDPLARVVIEEAIAGLTDDRREAFILTQVLGLSYQEAALAMDVPVGTVRSRVFRAREDLIEAMRVGTSSAEPRG